MDRAGLLSQWPNVYFPGRASNSTTSFERALTRYSSGTEAAQDL
jgi:hypothetical protein